VADAILIAWHPGTETGNALYDVLFGDFNPSGKLTTSWPNAVGQIPVYYNHRNSGRPKSNKYTDNDATPLFPFGYGMSYTTFAYSNLQLEASQITKNGTLWVSVDVRNTGKHAGTEIVQLYVRDLVGSTTRPVKELKGFGRVWLEPGETKSMKFAIEASQLAVLDNTFTPQIEPGKFRVWVGPHSAEGLESEFEITE
jgi:beta-glucosidase